MDAAIELTFILEYPGSPPLSRCITQQAHLGYNADAHAQSVKAVKAFLAEIFKLN